VTSAEFAYRHIRAEFADVVDQIVASLTPEGPYAYIAPAPAELTKEVPFVRVVTTLDEIEEAYNNIHRHVYNRGFRGIVELRGDWYTFMYGIGEVLFKDTGQLMENGPTALLFPTLSRNGVTGELYRSKWFETPNPDSEKDGLVASPWRVQGVLEQMLEAYRSNNADAVVALCHPEVQTAIPDYVNETGTITELHTSEEARAHTQDFFNRFHVQEIEFVNRHASDWFVFSELSWIVDAKVGERAGQTLTCRTVEITEIMPNNLVTARIGHGTPLTPVSI
jgi:hypothetical protein